MKCYYYLFRLTNTAGKQLEQETALVSQNKIKYKI